MSEVLCSETTFNYAESLEVTNDLCLNAPFQRIREKKRYTSPSLRSEFFVRMHDSMKVNDVRSLKQKTATSTSKVDMTG